MFLNYEPKALETLSTHFYNATGINLSILDTNFKLLKYENKNNNSYCGLVQCVEKGKIACDHSDISLLKKCKETKQTQMHICHAGLIDIAIPIVYENSIIGYIILGQIKTEKTFASIKHKLANLPIDLDKLKAFYDTLPILDEEKISSISNIAIMLAKYILIENLLKPTQTRNLNGAVDYITKNLNKNISVDDISKNVHISKSNLYKIFHNSFNCTISEFINNKRIELSIDLLIESNYTIDEISNIVGFSSVAYYSRLFKKIKGISPLKFRKTYSLQ